MSYFLIDFCVKVKKKCYVSSLLKLIHLFYSRYSTILALFGVLRVPIYKTIQVINLAQKNSEKL